MSNVNEPEVQPTSPPKSGRGLLVGALVAGSIAGSTIGAFVVAPAFSPSTESEVVESDSSEAAVATDEHGEPVAAATAPILLNNLVLNPADSRGTRFLLVSVGLQFTNALTTEAFEARETEVRDRVLQVLGTKTIDQLVDMRGRDGFRKEIADSVNALLGAGVVRSVYFPQFVIQ